MTKRKIILVAVVCASMAVFAVQTLSQTGGSNQTPKPSDVKAWQNMTEAERKREADQRLRKEKLEHERRQKDFEKRAAEQRKQWESGAEQREKKRKREEEEWEKEKREAGGFIYEKYALAGLGVTGKQWNLIKTKLEKVQGLRDKASSRVNVFLTSSSTSGKKPGSAQNQSVPTWQWKMPWKDKASSELTEAQKLAAQLVGLVERKGATTEQFRRTMDALRKARLKEAEMERQLAEASEELREGLTTRQEGALVLMGWL
jgi:hypothetical protein